MNLQGVVQRYHKFIYRNSTNYPFISGDCFGNLADFVYKKEFGFKAFDRSNGRFDVVFCESENLEQFLIELPKGFKPKILIVGNGDRDFKDININFPLSVSTVLLQNSEISDNKYIWTLPLGVENIRLGKNGIPKYLQSNLDFNSKKDLILFGPFGKTHLSRSELLPEKRTLNNNFLYLNSFLNTMKYAKTVQGVKWVVCPRGNGLDTHRVWETLYRGSLPIVEENNWSNSLRWLNIPFLSVSNFNEDEILRKISNKKVGNFDVPKSIQSLWMPFWENFIKNRLKS